MRVTGWDGWQNNSPCSLKCISNISVLETARTLTDILYVSKSGLHSQFTASLPLIDGKNLILCGIVSSCLFSTYFLCLQARQEPASTFDQGLQRLLHCSRYFIMSWLSYECLYILSNNLYRADDGLHVRLILKHNIACRHLLNVLTKKQTVKN